MSYPGQAKAPSIVSGLLLLLVSVMTPSLVSATNASGYHPGGIGKLGLHPAPGSVALAPHRAPPLSFGHTVDFGPSRITIAGATEDLIITLYQAKPVLPEYIFVEPSPLALTMSHNFYWTKLG